MTIEEEILINQYGQSLIDIDSLLQSFSKLDLDAKRKYLDELAHMIIQSKANSNDVNPAILASGLKETFTPCVLLSKGLTSSNLQKVCNLPDAELIKVLKLFLSIFKIAYLRRYKLEKDDPHKWWYWDLADESKLNSIKTQ